LDNTSSKAKAKIEALAALCTGRIKPTHRPARFICVWLTIAQPTERQRIAKRTSTRRSSVADGFLFHPRFEELES
jgi:hypothetical protein